MILQDLKYKLEAVSTLMAKKDLRLLCQVNQCLQSIRVYKLKQDLVKSANFGQVATHIFMKGVPLSILRLMT